MMAEKIRQRPNAHRIRNARPLVEYMLEICFAPSSNQCHKIIFPEIACREVQAARIESFKNSIGTQIVIDLNANE